MWSRPSSGISSIAAAGGIGAVSVAISFLSSTRISVTLYDQPLQASTQALFVASGIPWVVRMDQIDHRIIALLRENARRSFQDIGGHVALSAPAVKRRVDRLERDGIVRGYSANIDP